MKEVDELYGKMLAVFEEKTGFTMDDTADLAVRLYAAAAQIQTLYAYSDWAVNQSFPQTATGEYLDYHAALRGITRKAGTKARGSLRFRLDAAREDDLTVKCGTVCATAGLVRFVTTADGIIAAGELYADIPAEAESVGTSGNAGAETIAVMTRAPEGVSGVLNPKAFTGGSGAETDEELRARVLDSFIRLPNGANAAFYELRALSHAGVEAAVVIPRMNGIGTVGVVIAAPEGVPSEELLQQVQDDLDAVREIAVDVTVLAPEVQAVGVTAQLLPKTGVSFETAKAAAEKAVRALFTGALLGKSLYRAAISNAIFETGTVQNVKLLQPETDIDGTERTLCRLGEVTITEAEA